MSLERMKRILKLNSAPKSPIQLKEELCYVLRTSFILEADALRIDPANHEFELLIRARFINEEAN